MILTNISIHAPTRGATKRLLENRDNRVNFNPRSHKGSDFTDLRFYKRDNGFQSTLPQGERRLPLRGLPVFSFISIHAPTRGATFHLEIIQGFLVHFNPRSHKGSDNKSYILERWCKYFNPRSHKGSDTHNFDWYAIGR